MSTEPIECMGSEYPHAGKVKEVVNFFETLDDDPRFDVARTMFSITVFCRVLKLMKGDFSIRDYVSLLDENYSLTKGLIGQQSEFINDFTARPGRATVKDAAEATKHHYSTMFSNIRDMDFFEVCPANLKHLFELNQFYIDHPESKVALDAGCGSGRYSYALKSLGLSKVVGIDFSEKNIASAQKKIDSRGIRGIEFRVADVTDMPFEDGAFDFVFSNGVLHHIDEDWGVLLAELYRVLGSGGSAYLYVMESPGGILLDTIDVIRKVMMGVPEETTLQCMEWLGFRGYAIYNVLDHVYVPINKRISRRALEKYITGAGFVGMRKFTRGLPNYNIELLRKAAESEENIWKFGVGEHMYILNK